MAWSFHDYLNAGGNNPVAEWIADLEERVRAGLAEFTSKSVRLTSKIDPGVIGGVVVECEGKIIDGSLHTRLDRLKQAVLG